MLNASQQKPTEPGWYWFAVGGNWNHAVIARVDRGAEDTLYAGFLTTEYRRCALESFDISGEWKGPLQSGLTETPYAPLLIRMPLADALQSLRLPTVMPGRSAYDHQIHIASAMSELIKLSRLFSFDNDYASGALLLNAAAFQFAKSPEKRTSFSQEELLSIVTRASLTDVENLMSLIGLLVWFNTTGLSSVPPQSSNR